MRLRGCVAIELAVGGVLAAAGVFAVGWGAGELRANVAREASASVARDLRGRAPDGPAPASRLDLRIDVKPTVRPWMGLFRGRADDILLAPLVDAELAAVKLNRGGTSLSLRLDFEGGARAASKPSQIHLHSQPRREVAAYRVNRLIGLSSVSPSIGRRFQLAELVDRIPPDRAGHRERVLAEVVPEADGTVLAQLSWWIPVLQSARIDGYDVDSTEGIVTWKRYLTIGQPIADPEHRVAAQVSEMLVFDMLINNMDRWSGGNVKVSEDRRFLYFMDNTMAFGNNPNGNGRVRTYFERSQKFSRRLIGRLRHLREDEVRDAVTGEIEPFEFLLTEEEIAALMSRRDRILEYVDQLIETHGREAVLEFP